MNPIAILSIFMSVAQESLLDHFSLFFSPWIRILGCPSIWMF
jgi:hypothetical protein